MLLKTAVIVGDVSSQGTPYSSSIHALTGTTGKTIVVNSNVDDNFIQISLGLTFKYRAVSYTSTYVGSNTFLTWSAGSAARSSLTASNPPVPCMLFGCADNSFQRVYHGTEGNAKFIRYEGTAAVSGTGGSPNIVIEWYIYPSVDTLSRMMVVIGTHNRTGGAWFWSNGAGSYTNGSSTAFPAFSNTSYTYESTDSGSNWLIRQGSYTD